THPSEPASPLDNESEERQVAHVGRAIRATDLRAPGPGALRSGDRAHPGDLAQLRAEIRPSGHDPQATSTPQAGLTAGALRRACATAPRRGRGELRGAAPRAAGPGLSRQLHVAQSLRAAAAAAGAGAADGPLRDRARRAGPGRLRSV